MKKCIAGSKLTGVTRTMIWTLQPRADEHRRQDALFRDEMARTWFSRVASLEDTSAWYSPAYQTAIAIRTRVMDDATRRFIAAHDQPLIVELGAGLSTRPYRIGLAEAVWVMLDLPEAIELRQHLEMKALPTIACSVLDNGWMDQLPKGAPENILFIAEGLFMFLSKQECASLFRSMRARFPGARLLLDMVGYKARLGEVRIAEAMQVSIKWLIHDEQELAALGLQIIAAWPFLEQYPNRLKSILDHDWNHPGNRDLSLVIEAATLPGKETDSEFPHPTRIAAHEEQGPKAIRFRDRYYTAKKTFLYGQQRTCTPDKTLARIQPYLKMAGITRLADITGLDRIGIPVVMVTRPNAPTLSNSAGKGCSLEAAMVSGIMESIEVFHAEIARPPELFLPYNQLNKEKNVIPVQYLPFSKESVFNVDLPERWVMGWDLINHEEVAAPLQLVMLHSVVEQIGFSQNFQMGSNGLASGNHFLEALAAGLYEVIERDAVTTWQQAWYALGISPPRVRMDTIEYPLVRELLKRFETAQVQVLLFDTTSDTGIPTFMALIYDLCERNKSIAGGHGTHLDPEVAMLRALTEAAQSRVVGIAGSRDHYFRHHMALFKMSDSVSQIKRLEAIPSSVDARVYSSEAAPTFEADIHTILIRLRQVGLNQVIVFDLTLPDVDLYALRVIVPGLEGYMFGLYQPGPRARAFLQQKKTLQEG